MTSLTRESGDSVETNRPDFCSTRRSRTGSVESGSAGRNNGSPGSAESGKRLFGEHQRTAPGWAP